MIKTDVLIIGAGVIGASAALWCAEAGASVALIDRGPAGFGCSYGNAGFLAPAIGAPLAKPGAVWEGVRHLLNPGGPFSLHVSARPDFLRWMHRFLGCCNAAKLRSTNRVLHELCFESLALHRQLAQRAGAEYELDLGGLLAVYRDEQALRAALAEFGEMRPFGADFRSLSSDEIRKIEPEFTGEAAGGVLFQNSGRLDPYGFVSWLVKEGERRGVKVFPYTEALWLHESHGGIGRVVTTAGEFCAGSVVVASGASMPDILRGVGRVPPVLAGKGYSLTFETGSKKLRFPLLMDDTRLAVTPFKSTLRITGYLELGRENPQIGRKKAAALRGRAEARLRSLAGLNLTGIWRGFRPCTPDGLPVIGRHEHLQNLFLAGGHGTKGMLLGPVTGKIISLMLEGKPAGPFKEALSPARF